MLICSSSFSQARAGARYSSAEGSMVLAYTVRTACSNFAQPLLERAEVHAEDALVLAREGVAEAVLEEARGADDDWALAVVGEHLLELLAYLLGEFAVQQRLAQLGGLGEIALRRALLDAQLPAVVVDDVGVEDVGAYEEAVVRLGVLAEFGQAGRPQSCARAACRRPCRRWSPRLSCGRARRSSRAARTSA